MIKGLTCSVDPTTCMPIRNYILFLCLAQMATVASAQPAHINFTSLTSRDGLLSNSVNAILKDRYGLMWIATDDGLNKFDGTNFTAYRKQAGDTANLWANEILALHEDKAGRLWVGTSGGAVSLYDRMHDKFIHYPPGGGGDGFLSNAVVRSICSDYEGKIWIAQFSAPYVLDPATGHISKMDLTPYDHGGPNKLSLLCVFEDSRKRMWVGTDKGLFLYIRSTRTFKQYRHDNLDSSSLVNDYVQALAEDKEGHLWIGTGGGLCTMRPDEKAFISARKIDGRNSVLNEGQINAITVDNDGMLWVATMNGVHVLDPHTGHSVTYLPEEGNSHSLTSGSIRSLYIDKEGIYWFGTYRGGINKYDRNLNLFNVKLGDAFHDNGSQTSVVTSFEQQDDGNIWLGTDGGGLYTFDRKTEKLRPEHIRVGDRQPGAFSVLALKKIKTGALYIGTFAKGLIILDPVSGKARRLTMGPGPGDLNANDIYCIREDRQGLVWLGTNGAGINVLKNNKVIVRYTPTPKAPGDMLLPANGYIRAIEEDREGNMWIGTHGGGVAVYHPSTGKFTVYDQGNSNLPSDKIFSLLLDSRGWMWLGTYGGGLSVFDSRTGQFTNYTEKDGLQNATVYQVVEDARGQIWVSTNTGISSLDVQTKIFRNFTSYNGIQNNNFVHGSGLRSSDGELFFGGLQGFNYFNPAALTTNRNVPTVMLTNLQVANKPVAPGNESPIKEHISVAREVRLAYRQNFALSFVALNYTLPRQNHYAYKLEGFDKDWNYVDAMNTAYYTNLDPGEYVFHVKASNNDGVWSSRDTSVRIYVKPPFWRTPYAYVIYVLAAGGLLLYSRHRGLSRLRKKLALEQEREEARRIQELDRMKLKFLTNLSHEFRTPIALIMGPVDQMLSEGHGQPSHDKLQMVRRNARRLLHLVNQLLDFRKMEEHELRLHLEKGEFVSFVKDVCHSFTDLSERKHITFAFETRVDSLYVLFDRDKIERILFNLLSNAFKFTLEGGTITFALEELEGDDHADTRWISIKVMDTGIGIPQDKKEKIFQRFFQHASAAAILNQGTGIGLSITKEFVRMHGGVIEVESQPGQGSVFMIRLPLTKAAAGVTEEAPPPEIDAAEHGTETSATAPVTDNAVGMPAILLVEDNEDFRFYLKDNLRNKYKVIEAANGKDGWQKALSAHPQLIVSDISMPYMDGIELTRKLKGDKRTSHIPVILLTALREEEQQLKGLGTGANDYVTKPFNVEVLHARVRNLLALRNTLQTTFTRQINVLTPEVVIESEDEKLLNKVVTYLEKNLNSDQLSVESLSKEVGMSRSSLYSKILEITGETPVEYIRSFKLGKAKVLLEKSSLTIAEIAYEVGFSTPNYFARAFKAKYNILPSEYASTKK
ncbi:two-component regulator propeller domain-containing protein [Flavitalea sp. BT771]|uniref:hybrid sensor histidine kinase/response regulator transcription factor n=1 Tax=Flavitalea sp. BT771 TaxID=3063329 RepID=UPI0026E1C628|nr:hybrid sensor histidine kinase/response regulator transcription factor [Flavitalea sp. BT771]MDO6430334.1 two-component regulator propeller domain-containing protein [Flavitalea sp. BT771]MDV6219526.1 two-component regulator propeller domain-containing protein [Flavitalea sp. BT771]